MAAGALRVTVPGAQSRRNVNKELGETEEDERTDTHTHKYTRSRF